MQLWGPYLERNFLKLNLEPSPSQHLPWNFVNSAQNLYNPPGTRSLEPQDPRSGWEARNWQGMKWEV